MAGATFTTADAALKEDYIGPVREELNNDNMLLNQIKKNTKDFEGRRAVLSLHVSRNSGVGARNINGTTALPTAGAQGYAEERVGVHAQYGSIQVPGTLIETMKSDKGSFVRLIDSEMSGVVSDLKRDVNRQIFGTSDAVIAAVDAATTVNVIPLVSTTGTVILGQLEVGMVIDLGTVGSHTSVASARMITAIDETPGASTFTIDGAAVTTLSTTRVFRSGVGATDEVTGLQSIVDSAGTLFNVNPTTYPVWASYEKAVGGNLTENVLITASDNVKRKSGSRPDLLITSDGVQRNYYAQLQSIKRFVNTQELKGGFSGLEIQPGDASQTMTWDRDCPNGTVFGLSSQNIIEFVLKDWGWMDRDGAVLHRTLGFDNYQATLVKYHELATDARNRHFKLSGVTES